MVNVQPFVFQHVTAFKERLQLANKINEMIAVLNNTMDPEEVLAIVRAELVNYYTKEEVDDLIAGIDLSPYYTKTEVDGIIDGVQDSIDVITDDVDALEENKQNVLTPVAPITIEDNAISLKDFVKVEGTDWSSLGRIYFEDGHWNVEFYKDTLFIVDKVNCDCYIQNMFYKGTYQMKATATATTVKPYLSLLGPAEGVTTPDTAFFNQRLIQLPAMLKVADVFNDTVNVELYISWSANMSYKTESGSYDGITFDVLQTTLDLKPRFLKGQYGISKNTFSNASHEWGYAITAYVRD